MIALCVWFAVGVVLGRLSRLRRHRPRALALLMQPPNDPTFRDRLMSGAATMRGACSWCGGLWETCALGCVNRQRDALLRPIAMPVAGPGRPVSR